MVKCYKLLFVLLLLGGFSVQILHASSNAETAKPFVVVSDSDAKEDLDETRNRSPEILRDVKLLLSDVIIADFHRDTLEVIYTLSRIYDLLMEADQIGEKNLEDQEEFARFERSFMDI